MKKEHEFEVGDRVVIHRDVAKPSAAGTPAIVTADKGHGSFEMTDDRGKVWAGKWWGMRHAEQEVD